MMDSYSLPICGMLLIGIGIILQIFSVNGKYPYGEPTNGKFIHDMREFVNITFEWISPLTENGTRTEIPYCHEHRIRRTYYELPTPDISYEVMEQVAIKNTKIQTSTLVYPLVITVKNGSAEATYGYFAAAIHRIYDFKHRRDNKKKLIELLIVSAKIWSLIWDQWTLAQNEGLQYCYGGNIFDHILPLIYKDAETMPKYNQVVNQNYSDLTSTLCGLSKYCDCPWNKEETLTLAYPTEEGLQQFHQHRGHTKNNFPPLHRRVHRYSHMFMRDFALKSCYGDFEEQENMQFFKRWHNTKNVQCVFHSPYC